MTTTIAEHVSHLAHTMAAQPPNEVMRAFTQEQADLAAKAEMSLTALNNLERGASDPKASTLRAIRAALESAGIEFIGNGDAPGVRLRKR